jgi:hypothetical protein
MKAAAEILLFASVAMNAALLTFIAGVLRKVMNDMGATAFKHFVSSLVGHSRKSPFMLTILNVPFIAAIPYIYFYGIRDQWIMTGLAVWLAAGVGAKILKLPVYSKIATLDEADAVQLAQERKRLNNGNLLQATLDSAAAVLMLLTFIR